MKFDMNTPPPAFGETFEIDERVEFNFGPDTLTGIVAGISMKHVIFHYIVILDEPYVGMKAVIVQNTLMKQADPK